MFKESEFKRRMHVLGDYPNSKYKAKYHWNMLYWDGTRWWGDCVCIYKALLNGRDVDNPEVGSWCSDFSATGDCDEYGLISQCDDVDGNFSNINDGHIRILYMDGHIGGSFGEEFEVDGRICNVLECTTSWEGGGIVYSYCDTDGKRSHGKGEAANRYWELCGKPNKWIEREEEPQPEPEPEPTYEERTITYVEWKLLNIFRWSVTLQKGRADDYVRLVQDYLAYYNYLTVEPDGIFGDYTYNALKAWQTDKGLTADGIVNADDWAEILKG